MFGLHCDTCLQAIIYFWGFVVLTFKRVDSKKIKNKRALKTRLKRKTIIINVLELLNCVNKKNKIGVGQPDTFVTTKPSCGLKISKGFKQKVSCS